jgi:beta-phosphoglucomutase-like phosphatase (HAD superfamily)
VRGLIFDFDGVIADSEVLANTVLAETVTVLGRKTTLQEALDRYMGKRWPEVVALIEADIGQPMPRPWRSCSEPQSSAGQSGRSKRSGPRWRRCVRPSKAKPRRTTR